MPGLTAAMDISIQLILAISLLNFTLADPHDVGPQMFQPPDPQYAQKYKEVIMYLTPTQIRNYESGLGLPNFSTPAPPAYSYEQQKSEEATPINEEEGHIIQSTLNILEANKMHYHLTQQNNPELEITKAHVTQEVQNADIRPIVEHNVEENPVRGQLPTKSQQEEQDKLIDQLKKNQEQVAKSYAYIHFFTNKKPDGQEKIQIFHLEPNAINLHQEIKQNENNVEVQQDPLHRQKYKLIPYEYVAGESQEIHEQVREQLTNQRHQEHLQLFLPDPPQLQAIHDKERQVNNQIQHQYAPQFTSISNNVDLEKIIKDIQLERELAKIHAEAIAKSPPIVIHKDIRIIRRRPVHVTKHVNVPYPAPYFVPVPRPVEVKVPQPYAVPVEVLRQVPVPIEKTETVEVEKPVPYEVEKRVPEIVEKKVYVPVEKPYTVERFVPVEIKKEIPVEVPVHKPERFTIIRHVWKH